MSEKKDIRAIVAPFYDTKARDYANMSPEKRNAIREDFFHNARILAELCGLPFNPDMTTQNVGGFENEQDNKLIEISHTFSFKKADKQVVDLFAALMAEFGYEGQESTISARYCTREEATAPEYKIYVNNLEGLTDILSSCSINDYTINVNKKYVSVLAWDENDHRKINEHLIEKLKEYGYYKKDTQKFVESRYLGRSERAELYQGWLQDGTSISQMVMSQDKDREQYRGISQMGLSEPWSSSGSVRQSSSQSQRPPSDDRRGRRRGRADLLRDTIREAYRRLKEQDYFIGKPNVFLRDIESIMLQEENNRLRTIVADIQKDFSSAQEELSSVRKENQIIKTHYNELLNDEFRRIQEESRNLSEEQVSRYHREGNRSIYDNAKRRLGTIYERLLARGTASSMGGWSLKDEKSGNVFYLIRVDATLFHKIFEINRQYLENGELVDCHDDYSSCKCFLSTDGLCGFAIEPDGNLISVFSLNPTDKRGFLYAISHFVTEQGATHLDAYASDKQNLETIYAKTLSFQTAATMDYNIKYDHDSIAERHGYPNVVFMVWNPIKEVANLHFGASEYEAAKEYQMSNTYDRRLQNYKNKILAELILKLDRNFSDGPFTGLSIDFEFPPFVNGKPVPNWNGHGAILGLSFRTAKGTVVEWSLSNGQLDKQGNHITPKGSTYNINTGTYTQTQKNIDKEWKQSKKSIKKSRYPKPG